MPQMTFYPDAHPETSSVDGRVRRAGVDESWATIRTSDGNTAEPSTATANIAISASGTSNQWEALTRAIFLFDVSSLPFGAVVSSAVLSFYGSQKLDDLNITPDLNVYASNPASNTDLVAADYNIANWGSTAFSTAITYANWLIVSPFWNDFILNAAGIAAVQAAIADSRVVKLGLRNANYDVAATTPAWVSLASSYLGCYTAEQGSGFKPKLVVTYTLPDGNHCRIAFESAPYAAAPAWKNISSDLRAISIRKGRQHALDRMEAATAIVTLGNDHYNYYPNNTGGAYYPNVRPGKRLNIQSTYNSTAYDIFTGYITDYNPDWLSDRAGKGAIMRITAVGIIGNLARLLLDGMGFSAELSGTRVGNVLNKLSSNIGRDLATGQSTMQALSGASASANALSHLAVIQQSEGGYIFEAGDGDVQFHDRHTRLKAPYITSQAIFADAPLDVGSGAIDRPSYENPANTLIDLANPATLTGTLISVEIWAHSNLTGLRVGTFYLVSGTTYKCRDSETIGAVTAGSKQTFSVSINIEAGDFIGCYFDTGQIDWSASGGSGYMYIAGEYIDPEDQAVYTLAANQAISLYGTGLEAMRYIDVELSYDDDFIYNDVRITRSGGTEQTATDATSQTSYGQRSLSRSGLLMTTDSEALSQAQYLLARYKGPALRAKSIMVYPDAAPANLYPKVLGYDIGTRITFRLGQAGINADYHIEGIEHNWDARQNLWKTNWQLSDADNQAYWVWDTSLWDTGKWAY